VCETIDSNFPISFRVYRFNKNAVNSYLKVPPQVPLVTASFAAVIERRRIEHVSWYVKHQNYDEQQQQQSKSISECSLLDDWQLNM